MSQINVLSVTPGGPDKGRLTVAPGKSILRPTRSSHTTTPPPSSADLPHPNPPPTAPAPSIAFVPSSRTVAESASNHEDASMEGFSRSMQQIGRTVRSLKQRGDQYKQQLRASLKQTSDLRLESAEGSRELRGRVEMLEEKVRKSEAAKEKAKSRLRAYKGHLKSEVTREHGSSDSSLYPVSSYIGHLEPLPPFSYHSCKATETRELSWHFPTPRSSKRSQPD